MYLHPKIYKLNKNKSAFQSILYTYVHSCPLSIIVWILLVGTCMFHISRLKKIHYMLLHFISGECLIIYYFKFIFKDFFLLTYYFQIKQCTSKNITIVLFLYLLSTKFIISTISPAHHTVKLISVWYFNETLHYNTI